MGGGLLNLIASRKEDIVLIGNPSMSFFKKTFISYTNFGRQKFRIDFEGTTKLNNNSPSTFTFKIPKLSLTIASSGHLYKQKTIPRIFLHALISLAHQNTSSGILADKRPEKLVPPAFPALQSPIISSLSVCLPSSARFTLCPPP